LPLQTLYAYDPIGQLTNITYGLDASSPSPHTPAITYTYDRLGRQLSARTGEACLALFTYDPATLALTRETIITGGTGSTPSVTNILTRTQDTLGRPAGLSVDGVGDPVYSVTYAYDDVGRFASLQSSVSGLQSNLWHYTYLPDSDLLSGWDNGTLSTVRTYEPNRNLITDIETRTGDPQVALSRFHYENDPLGRRTKRVDNASITNNFGYNIRSEVIEALMGTNAYNYAYDPIGNREQASLNAVTNFYAANALNQYTNISNGTVVEPTYDDDGNMLTYNGWTFTWNGENRLITASNTTTLISNTYDYMGRRIQKVVNGVTNNFVYDGWAMIREQSATVTNSYVYGIDLSGSMQGAGTIGGILSADLNGTTFSTATTRMVT
jgi:hypothetical protein